MNEVVYTDAPPIDGYGAGFFRVGGELREGAQLIGPAGVQVWGGYRDADSLLALVGQVDVLFVGTGRETTHLPRDLRDRLEAAGLGVEAMNSPAACRSYNVLLAEGRRVAVALLPV